MASPSPDSSSCWLPRRVAAVEAVEDVRQGLRRDAGAGVSHRQGDGASLPAGRQGDLPAGRRVAQRVGHQVAEHLDHPLGVNHDIRQLRLSRDLQCDVARSAWGA